MGRFPHQMRFMNRTSDEDAERLLERRVPWGDGGSELGEVSIFLDAVRADAPVPTSPAGVAAGPRSGHGAGRAPPASGPASRPPRGVAAAGRAGVEGRRGRGAAAGGD